jgi:hypothetical protein
MLKFFINLFHKPCPGCWIQLPYFKSCRWLKQWPTSSPVLLLCLRHLLIHANLWNLCNILPVKPPLANCALDRDLWARFKMQIGLSQCEELSTLLLSANPGSVEALFGYVVNESGQAHHMICRSMGLWEVLAIRKVATINAHRIEDVLFLLG